MKEWHGGLFVTIDGAANIAFNDVQSDNAGAGYIEVRYSLSYANAQMDVSVNGGASIAVPMDRTPNEPGYVPSEWRTVRIPVTFQSGLNSIVLSKPWGGELSIDEVLFSTPDDAALASAHVRGLNAGDVADLIAYLSALDSSSAAQPEATLRRGGVIAVGAADSTLYTGPGEEALVYTIENNGDGILDLGAFHVDGTPSGDIWIAQQPEPQVAPGESTTLELRLLPGSTSATAQIQGWTNDPAVENLHWTLEVQNPGGGGGCVGVCLEVAADGATAVMREVGDDVSFRVAAQGDAPITYQWYRELPDKAVEEVLDGNGATLTLSNLDLADSGTYYCVVEDANEIMRGPSFQLTVVSALPASGAPGILLLIVVLAAAGMRRRS